LLNYTSSYTEILHIVEEYIATSWRNWVKRFIFDKKSIWCKPSNDREKHIFTLFIIIFQLKEISHVCNEHLWFMNNIFFSNAIYLVQTSEIAWYSTINKVRNTQSWRSTWEYRGDTFCHEYCIVKKRWLLCNSLASRSWESKEHLVYHEIVGWDKEGNN
jgi:hypothetical protein